MGQPSRRWFLGFLLLLTAIAAAAMVWTRLESNTNRTTLEETFRAIDENSTWFNWHGTARIWFGTMLLTSQYFIGSALASGRGFGSGLAKACLALRSIAFIASGVITTLLPNLIVFDAALGSADPEQYYYYRGLAGNIRNWLVGLELILLGPTQWRPGSMMKPLALLGTIIGVAMILVWWDAATELHRESAAGFMIWLVVTALVLITTKHGDSTPVNPAASESNEAHRFQVQ